MGSILLLGLLVSYPPPAGCFSRPSLISGRVIVTDEAGSAIYLIETERISRILARPGCGFWYSVSPDGRKLGVKIIQDDGYQYPALLDLDSKTVLALHEPVPFCGQPGFTNDGVVAFTIGEELLVLAGDRTDRFDLDSYANLAPISPDGKYVAYNDQDDRLWLLCLETGRKQQITDSRNGCFSPVWAQDSRKLAFRSLTGVIRVYGLASRTTWTIGKGGVPTWSADSRFLVYHRTETDGRELLGSDLYLSGFDASRTVRLTDTPAVFEMDPSFGRTGEIVFHNYSGRTLFRGTIENEQLIGVKGIYSLEQPLELEYRQVPGPVQADDSLDIPYIHQVYDTPDWFNGHWACAPTTAMMAIAHFLRLPKWSCQCSSPYPHTSHWGRYICERYRYGEENYNLEAQDPDSNWAKGGYGYMWSGSNRPSNSMARYVSNHGIESWHDWSPTLNEAIGELNAGYPYSMCVGLTTSGHLVLGVGYAGNGIIVCNDPYGNKNLPGYPNYFGKYARYDWPGYNNGYQNLNSVYWTVGSRAGRPAPADTLVDDLAIEQGFYLHTAAPSSMAFWHDRLAGYNSHFWWTYTTASADTCYAVWTPILPAPGDYEVSAFIPGINATATQARYRIHYQAGDTTVFVNQAVHSDEWVSLGIYPFGHDSGCVRLGDATGTQGRHIAFDALKWSACTGVTEYRSGCPIGHISLQKSIVNHTLCLSLNLKTETTIMLAILDKAGRCVLKKNHTLATGEHRLRVRTEKLPAGVYFASLSSNNFFSLKKFILVR